MPTDVAPNSPLHRWFPQRSPLHKWFPQGSPLHTWFPQGSPLHKWFEIKLRFPNTFLRLPWLLFKAMFKLKIITSWWSIITITSLICIYKYCRNIYRDNNNDTEVLFWKLYVHFVHDWNNVSKHYIWKCIKFSTFCNKIEN